MPSLRSRLLLLLCVLALPMLGSAAPSQWIYVLRVIPRLHDDQAWTEDDKRAVGTHFAHLQEATKRGQVIFAGRTMESSNRTFGLVIFEAEDEAAAHTFMMSDPAVQRGVMTAELHSFALVLSRTPRPPPASAQP